MLAGIHAGSVVLVGFGVDSFIEVASAIVVGWRLLEEMRGVWRAAERQAEGAAGAILVALALGFALERLI